ncbi:MAG: VCBS repeat-containing protein [Verrucomicrobiae bacterium]|nr:VCBS repeat-containing protein [Verrucomicrobiae bacterium]
MSLQRILIVPLCALALISGACHKPQPAGELFDLDPFNPRNIGNPVEGLPWITDLHIADLDQDGLKDVIAAEGKLNQILWIRQVTLNHYEEKVIGQPVRGPAHIKTADLDQDGDLDVLVAGMGIVTPNNDSIGSVVVLENNGQNHFTNRVLLEDTYRVTYVEAGDLDGDGDSDLVVGQFGYYQGEVRWMEQTAPWKFESHSLLDLPGTIHVPIVDVDQDGDKDLLALVSQNWENIYRFENNGKGEFSAGVIYGSTNKDYGSSGISIADIDQDGDMDIAYTNGDGFDYSIPGSRPWHGVQWLENDGSGTFLFHRVGDFSGSYSPVVVDIEGDGDQDILAVSGFNDWNEESSVSVMLFENMGSETFRPHVLAHTPTHLVVVDAADMDEDGAIEFVTGGMYFYPPFNQVSRISLWDTREQFAK